MKYREIAKQILLDRLAVEVKAEDGQNYHEDAGGKDFTPKQVRKLNEALESIGESLKKKWKL